VLRMPLKIVKILTGLVLVFALAQIPTIGKCVSLQLTLKGTIDGPAKDLKVVVEVTSGTHGDSAKDVRQESSIAESRFRVLAWFNTTSNIVSAETCDRKPHWVTVKLMRGNQVLDRRELTVETDFRLTKTGEYELRKPIALHSGPTAADLVT
jgi:hypothetical protein